MVNINIIDINEPLLNKNPISEIIDNLLNLYTKKAAITNIDPEVRIVGIASLNAL